MAKLNKQEVAAIAGKLHRELEKAAILQRQEAIKTYNPSELYQQAKELTSKRDEVLRQMEQLQAQKEEYVDQIERLFREKMGWWWKGRENADKLLHEVVETECSLKTVPSIDELKDNVTIAAIDDGFNTASFIEQQLALFQ